MTSRALSSSRPRPTSLAPLARWHGVVALLALSGAAAADLPTALPHRLHVGPSLGFATAPHVDPRRARRATALPGADDAQVRWQKQVPGGVSCNVLVDQIGRIFVAGQGRVSQLGPDGSLQFSTPSDFSSAAAAALLADGTRVVLTREARLMGWSPAGALVFEHSLDAPVASAFSSLLPLPDGGVLASLGPWLFTLDSARSTRPFASLSAPVQHTLLSEGRAVAVDERGRAFEWGRSEPRLIGVFSGPVAAVAADGSSLVGASGRSLERLGASGELHELARYEAPGLAPLVALPIHAQPIVIQLDGVWSSPQGGASLDVPPRRGPGDSLTRLDLLADAHGTVAWWAAEVPLRVEAAPGAGRELNDVRCAAPASLVPAGDGRLVAACNSGVIWLIGPGNASVPVGAGEPANLTR